MYDYLCDTLISICVKFKMYCLCKVAIMFSEIIYLAFVLYVLVNPMYRIFCP